MCKRNIWLCLAIAAAQLAAAQPRPNIIYIMADDLGYADLGSYGSTHIRTPNLDRMGREGVKFTQAYAAAPVCTPTRTALITGRYPARTPVGLREPLDWTAADSTIGLTPDIPSLPGLLRQAGYRTYLVGKWHLGFGKNTSPNANGFDEFLGYHGGGVDYISHTDPKGNPDLYENDQLVHREGYTTDILRDRAVEIIGRRHDKPWFLSLQFSAPHWPWQVPGDSAYPRSGDGAWKAGGSPQVYATMVERMDEAVGAILKALDASGQAANTLVIFTSDNGGEKFSDMGPFTGRKFVLWEGGIRVPAIMRWPGSIKAGTVSAQPVITMDWTATMLALAGAKANKAYPLDGINVMPLLQNHMPTTDREFYWRIFQRKKEYALRSGPWKYLKDEKGEYLFDLASDPGEKNNLRELKPDVFQALKIKYAAWEQTVLTPIPQQ